MFSQLPEIILVIWKAGENISISSTCLLFSKSILSSFTGEITMVSLEILPPKFFVKVDQ